MPALKWSNGVQLRMGFYSAGKYRHKIRSANPLGVGPYIAVRVGAPYADSVLGSFASVALAQAACETDLAAHPPL